MLLNCCFGYSQESSVPYINYTTKDGLPSNEVYDVLQDDDGYMWFATDNGVSRYDGYEFKNYGPSEGLKDRVVFTLQKDKDGKIWMAGFGGKLYFYNKDKDLIETDPKINIIISSCTSNSKIKFKIDDLCDIWVYCNNRVYVIHPNYTFELFTENSKGVGFSNEELYTYDFEAKVIKIPSVGTLQLDINILKNLSFTNVFTFRNYFILSFDKLAVIINKKNKEIKYLNLSLIDNFLEINNLNFLVGFQNNAGLQQYKNEDDFLSRKGESFISNISISGLIQDNQDNYWASTTNKGVIKTNNLKSVKFIDFKDLFHKSNIVKISSKDNNTMVILNNGDKILLDKISSRIIKKSNIGTPSLTKIYPFFEKEFLIDGNGFISYRKNGILIKINSRFSVKHISVDSLNKDHLIVSSSAGLIIYDVETKTTKFLNKIRSSTHLKTINNDFLVGTNEGLFVVKNDSIKKAYGTNNYDFGRIDFINYLGNSFFLLVSKSGFINIFKNGSHIPVYLSKYDKYETINNVFVDKNDVWITTTNKIFILKIINGKVVNQINLTNKITLPDGPISDIGFDKEKVYIAFSNSFLEINRSFINAKDSSVNTPIIEYLKVNNREVQSQKASFSYLENNIIIKVLCINYKIASKIRYKYSINGSAYNEMGTNRELTFYQLSPGNYNFKFIAENEDGFWSQPLSYKFQILPPWWQTNWFYGTMIGLSFLSVVFFFKIRENNIVKSNALKEEITNLEKAALQAQMNPHFIFNSLNSIQKYILTNDKIMASEYLSDFAKLIRLNLKFSNTAFISLAEELEALLLYLEIEKLRFKDKFDYIIDDSLVNDIKTKAKIPPMLIQPLLENAILHGIASISKKGIIKVSFNRFGDNYLSVSVTDNGEGLKERRDNIDHTSLGSLITKRRINLISKDLSENFSIKNIEDEDGNIIGVEARIVVKLQI